MPWIFIALVAEAFNSPRTSEYSLYWSRSYHEKAGGFALNIAYNLHICYNLRITVPFTVSIKKGCNACSLSLKEELVVSVVESLINTPTGRLARTPMNFFICYCFRPEYSGHPMQAWADESLMLTFHALLLKYSTEFALSNLNLMLKQQHF